MIIYEVNHLDIQTDIYDSYRAWLDAHAREMLALPGFVKAALFQCRDLTADAESRSVCVQYHLQGTSDLDRYLAEDAPRMRADGARRFPGAVRIVRRVLMPARSQL